MGTKNLKGSVSIEHIESRIRLRWRFQKKRYSLNLFHFTKSNLLQAKKVAIIIEGDIQDGNFDEGLEKYKHKNLQGLFNSSKDESLATNILTLKPRLTNFQMRNSEEKKIINDNTLISIFEEWVKNYRNMDCERDIDYNSTRNMMRRWGGFQSNDVVTHFNKETFGSSTYNRRLSLLSAFFEWTTKTKITTTNPLEDVLPKKVRRTEKPKRKPFTVDEIKSILEAFNNNTFCSPCSYFKHSHYYPFVYFCFKVGPRNGEAIGLRVSNVDIANNLIHIKEQLSRTIKGTNPSARQRKDTKNGKHRVIPFEDDLKDVLRPLLENKNPDDLVFTSPKRLPINDASFQKRIFSKILKGLSIAPRNLYAARHTFGSRCIESGLTPVMTAFLMGNNPQTALRNYTHQISLPSQLPKIG